MKPRVFQVIDLDRTIFNTSRFVELITNKIDELEPGLGSEIEARFEAAYAREETFFALEFIRQRFGEERYNKMVNEVTAPFGADYWCIPGAKQRLDRADELTSLRPSYGILTYSQNTEDQYRKLQLIGFSDAPVLVTDTPDKARVLESWRQPDGTFILPQEFGAQTVNALTLEDDKLRAYTDLPNNVLGLWLTQDAPATHKLTNPLYAHVVAVKDLNESLEELLKRY